MPHSTAAQRLATLTLGQPVDEWVRARRAESMSWRKIAAALREQTDGQVDVTDTTLLDWARRAQDSAA